MPAEQKQIAEGISRLYGRVCDIKVCPHLSDVHIEEITNARNELLKELGIVNKYPIKASRIAAFVVGVAIFDTDEVSVTDFWEIEENFPSLKGTGWSKDKDFLKEIGDELVKYPQFQGDINCCSVYGAPYNCIHCEPFPDYCADEYMANE